jgi:hypothetical protein
VARIVYPAREGRWFFLNDERKGGLQAFAVVLSSKPLPAYQEWKARRGDVAWKKRRPGKTVWEATCELAEPKGRLERGQERDLPASLAMRELCQSLRKAGAEKVKALAFPVLPRQPQ